MKVKLFVLLIASSLLMVTVSSAQETLDTEALADVAIAFEATSLVNSLRLQSQTVTTGSQSAGGASIASQQTVEMDLLRTAEAWNAYSRTTNSITLPFGEISFDSEMIWLDGLTYLRFSDVPPAIPVDLPTTWVDLEIFSTEQGEDNANLPLGTAPEAMMSIFALPLTDEALEGLVRLAADEIDGQSMAVYQVTLDAAAILESDAAALFNIGAGNGGGIPTGFPPQGLVPPANAPDPANLEIDPANVQMTFAVYIGQADGFIHRIYRVVNVGGDLALSQTTLTNYSDFNTTIEITAPELGS
jgi:hypothetical protein